MGTSLAPGRVQVWLLPQLEISEVAVHETGEPSALSTSLSGSFERPTRDAFPFVDAGRGGAASAALDGGGAGRIRQPRFLSLVAVCKNFIQDELGAGSWSFVSR